MSLSRLEQETIIVFNEQEAHAEIFTYNGRLRRELSELSAARPDDVRHTQTNTEGGETYAVPKAWVKVRASRILSDAQRAAIEKARLALGNPARAEA